VKAVLDGYDCMHRDPATKRYCERMPVHYAALAAGAPVLWSDTAPPASLALFCCEEHARAVPVPTLADASRVRDLVMAGAGCTCGRCDLDDAIAMLWDRLIAAYPEPLPLRP
jgi:hypothetical protein